MQVHSANGAKKKKSRKPSGVEEEVNDYFTGTKQTVFLCRSVVEAPHISKYVFELYYKVTFLGVFKSIYKESYTTSIIPQSPQTGQLNEWMRYYRTANAIGFPNT